MNIKKKYIFNLKKKNHVEARRRLSLRFQDVPSDIRGVVRYYDSL